ncbi:hypothetical protein [Haloflavibacter putidus]|uniref:Uncharacterized protein n=1 Tax=Haloflavibacter putidus TaxID=2576776 RepID=A0A507ZMK1_9FLAO|nr:hypothetical protein [Haloflavibacter putidus]TQD38770.1 hypothetical protein FKR84_07205 [Haloflavibacter putidus]
MASIRNLKRDVNNVMAEIIEAAYIHQLANPTQDKSKSNAIVEEAISVYDALLQEINAKNVSERSKHYKEINQELEEKSLGLVEKLNAL